MERRDVGLSVGTFSMSQITGRRTPDVRTREWSLISGATAGESAGDRPGHHQVLAQVHPPPGEEGLGLVGVSQELHLQQRELLGQQLLPHGPPADVSPGIEIVLIVKV